MNNRKVKKLLSETSINFFEDYKDLINKEYDQKIENKENFVRFCFNLNTVNRFEDLQFYLGYIKALEETIK